MIKSNAEIIILFIFSFCFYSCSNSCTANNQNANFRKDSVVLYEKVVSDEFRALRIVNSNTATYIYEDCIVQLNLKSLKKTTLFDGKLLKDIDFVNVLNDFDKDTKYYNPDVEEIQSDYKKLLTALFTERKLINYWIDKDMIYVFVKASTPSLENNKIIAGTSKFLLSIKNSKVIAIKPLKCSLATLSIEDATIFMENNTFYFPTLPILFKDSIPSFTSNRPSLIISYQIDSGSFSIINLKMTDADLNSYIRFIQKTESSYCSFVNVALILKYNGKRCYSDSKNIFYCSNLDSPIFKTGFLNPEEDVISALPSNNTTTGEVMLFYKGVRNEEDGKITMILSALNTCNGKILQSIVVDHTNKCSKVAIYKESAYYINYTNDKLYWVKLSYR